MDSGRTNSRKGRTDRGESQNSYLDDFYKKLPQPFQCNSSKNRRTKNKVPPNLSGF